MATTFGTRPEDTSADSRGNVNIGVVIQLYPSKADAEARTNLIASPSTNALGLFPYDDPEGRYTLWARDPAGRVWAIESEGAEPGNFQDAVNAAQAAAEQAASSAATAASDALAGAQAQIDASASSAASSAASAASAASLVQAPADTVMATIMGNPASATAGVLNALPYVPAMTLTLPNPAYIAHRGGAGIAPEETMDAFRVSVAAGADGLEMDLQPLADGALGLMHDATVDRTTDGTGSVSAFTAPSWQALNAAAKFPWNGKVAPPAMLPQVLGEFGGQVVLFIEPKDQTNAVQLMNALDKKNLRANAVIEISDPAMLSVVKARGYKVYFWWGSEANATTAAIGAAVSGGADYLGGDGVAFSDAKISELVATGLPVLPYTINRRATRDRLLALGVKGFLTDQPVYVKANTAQRTVDSWRQGVFGHGLNSSAPSATNVVGGALTLTQLATQYAQVGEVSPVANAAGSYTVDVDLAFQTLPTSGSTAVALHICAPDDKQRTFSGAAGSYGDGYSCYLRQNGQLSLFRTDSATNSATALGTTVTTAALTAGGFAHLKATVTPTQITLSRTDGTTTTIGPIATTNYRGGYISVGRTGADGEARFKNLAIT